MVMARRGWVTTCADCGLHVESPTATGRPGWSKHKKALAAAGVLIVDDSVAPVVWACPCGSRRVTHRPRWWDAHTVRLPEGRHDAPA